MENQKINLKMLPVFGPKIGMLKLPDYVVESMLKITDNILSDKNKISHGKYLAGQVKKELVISLDLLKKENLYDFFNNIQSHYVTNVLREKKSTKINDMWVNSQFENEYNPIHYHDGCTISSTFYLKMPKTKPRMIENKKDVDGNIVFINNNHSNPFFSLENALFNYKPNVGDMFIWPSRLLHGVYPFQGKGERRSVAFNGIHV